MKVPCNYNTTANFYTRFAVGSVMDFSDRAMFEAFESETFGVKHDLRNNGFAFGKKSMDITIAAWVEDLKAGDICKHELLKEFEEGSWEYKFVWDKIKDVPVKPLFGYLSIE